MAEPLRLFAAGSLGAAFAGLCAATGLPVQAEFGPSGGLRARIEAGADWDIFASADTGHPARLAAAGLGSAPRVFCRNSLALILRPGLAPDRAEALMARSDLRLGISTPGNDPSGDYAVAALDRLDPALASRALRLTGAEGLAKAPPGRNTYAWVLAEGLADMFLTYRTNARAAQQDMPDLRILDMPAALAIRAEYALTIRIGASSAAQALAGHILGPDIQSRLVALGFDPATENLTLGETA